MKTFKFTVAVTFLLAVLLIKDSCALASSQDVLQVRDGDVMEPFQMQSEQPKMSHFVGDRHRRDEKYCRWCCNCCSRGPTWCGVCCEW
ncbi:hepcidin-like [Stigmatopora argus]